MIIHDVSRRVGPGAWVWPGDRPFDCRLNWKIAEGATVNVGEIAMSVHCGTHIDAPFHFDPEGPRSERIPLENCIGECDVLPLARLAESTADRVLVKAAGGAPTVAQLEALGRRLKLFGTDHHSVDPMDSRTLDAHHALWRMGAAILEELDLSRVPDGRYRLVALPLLVEGMDAAPTRAILLEGD